MRDPGKRGLQVGLDDTDGQDPNHWGPMLSSLVRKNELETYDEDDASRGLCG